MPPSHLGSHTTHQSSFLSEVCTSLLNTPTPGSNTPHCVPVALITTVVGRDSLVFSPTLLCVLSLSLYPWATSTGLGRLGMFVNRRVGRQPPGH